MASVKNHMKRRRLHLAAAKRNLKNKQPEKRRKNLRLARKHLELARRHKRAARARAARSSVSGLTPKQRSHARKRAVQAALLGSRNRGSIHYTQGGSRWQGIDRNLQSKHGQFPRYCDCSSFATWCLWNALRVAYRRPDNVNGLGWRAGYTGTMLNHGKRVSSAQLVAGDCVIYGRGFPGSHTAIYVGRGMVVSHGSEAGPLYVRWNYRGDITGIRRYI